MPDRSAEVIAALIARHESARVQLRQAVLVRVLRALRLVGDAWYDDRAVAEAAARAMGVVRAGQQRQAALTARALTSTTRALDPRAAGRPPAVELPSDLRYLDGTGSQYTRPAREFRRLRVLGADDAAASAAAQERATKLVVDDLALAHRHAARATILEFPAVTGWRRVLHPEKSENGVCGLCVVASTQVYGREQLLEIHDGCNCDVMPIVGGRDPGRAWNSDELKRLYAAAGGTEGSALKEVRVQVHEHGELGPVLRRHGEAFRGPKEVARANVARGMTPERARVELATLERTLADLETRAAAGEPVSGPLEYQRTRVELLRGLAA